jgi:hypothetical protein
VRNAGRRRSKINGGKYMSEFRITDAVVVSWDFSHGTDKGVLIVGRQENKKMKIVNAFQGQEAFDIYKKLTTKKEGE